MRFPFVLLGAQLIEDAIGGVTRSSLGLLGVEEEEEEGEKKLINPRILSLLMSGGNLLYGFPSKHRAAAFRLSLLLCGDSLAFPGEKTLKKKALMNESVQWVTLGPRNHSTRGVWAA